MRSEAQLAVIGAGPKGLAVAVKAKVLTEFGLPAPKVTLVERHSVAAHWSGEAGYTDGAMKLGTSPEKDVVFPLETQTGDAELDDRIRRRLADFSWYAYLTATQSYADWIDRGRPAPCHAGWAAYLRWVSARLAPEARLRHAEVTGIDLVHSRWVLRLSDGGSLRADQLMFTGPGRPRLDFDHEIEALQGGKVLDLESFWAAHQRGEMPEDPIAIVGTGENAASVLLALSSAPARPRIEVISPQGFIATRAENYYENQFYSDPDRSRWKDLSPSDRRQFIARTDLGVFSVQAMALLNEQRRHHIVPGRVTALARAGMELKLTIDYHGRREERTYKQVILATGFDQSALLRKLMSERALAAIGESFTDGELAQRIGSDLALEGLHPRLHLPMLAGVRQGPGFANLSCLGRLSDRVVATDAIRISRARAPLLAEVGS